jgi:phosphate-selective porin
LTSSVWAFQPQVSDSTEARDEGPPQVGVSHGEKGWEFSTTDGNYRLQIQSRLQFRYATPFDTEPRSFEELDQSQHLFKVNRARLKVGGNAFAPWLTFFWEYELASANLLDFRLMIEKHPFLSLKIGQWKVHFNRERVISSGKQQLADRSLITRPFTIDRQQGVSLYGRLKGDGLLDFNYWASVLTGTGRGSKTNDDDYLMVMVRGQWNLAGGGVAFAGSDTKFHQDLAAILAFALVTNRSPYTRFSQEGGGQLPGFGPGEPGQYRVNQWVAESALMYRGLSWQQEFHWKEINDLKNRSVTTMVGNYAQFGYFVYNAIALVPEPLELAFRHAFFVPDIRASDNLTQEFSLAVNWFFKGHLNKVTAAVSLLAYPPGFTMDNERIRFRLQWDVSI